MNPKLLFLSGWAKPADEYPSFEKKLSEHFDLQIIDSTRFRSYEEDICQRIQQYEEPIWLSGWSMGAMVALKTAAMLPDRINGLILLSPTPSFCIREDFSSGTAPGSVRALARGLKLTPSIAMSTFFKMAVRPAKISKAEQKDRVAKALQFEPAILQEDLKFLEHTDIREDVASITAPTLLIHGEEDTIIPPEASQWLNQHIKNSISIFLSDTGHDLPVIHYEATADIMIRFQKGLS